MDVALDLRQPVPGFPYLVTHSVAAGEVREVARFAQLRDAEVFVARSDVLDTVALDNPLIRREVDRQFAELVRQREELSRTSILQEAEIEAEKQRRANEAIEKFLQLSLAEVERQLITATVTRLGGNREASAKALGIDLRTLHGKLKSYGWQPRQKAA